MSEQRGGVSLAITLVWIGLSAGVTAGGVQSSPPPPTAKLSAPVTPAATPAATTASALSDVEMEQFLKEAKVVREKGTKKGVTGSTQATLSNGGMTHDAHIQIVDEFKREFRTDKGVELDFRDSWSYNIAAYKLDRLIGLNLVPVSVQRSYRSNRAAFTWWVDEVMIDEGDRLKKKLEPPDKQQWGRQIAMMRLFDELIANSDRNLGNMLYSKEWRLWAIDHTRAFRKYSTLKHPTYVSRCDRAVFERLKALDRDTLKRELGAHLDDGHIKSILARRDLIVKRLEGFGPTVLFDR